MNEKWVCGRCGNERFAKPMKNEACSCHGRFRHFVPCKVCGDWFPTHGATVCTSCAENGFKRSHGSSVGVVCAYCGKSFRRPKANAKGKRQFCDIDCQRAYERTLWSERTCKECGKPFKVRESAIRSSNASGNYCSRDCYERSLHLEGSKQWRNGFERVKRQSFGGVQFCAICGTTKNIHIHHIIPYRMTKDNGTDNLIPLCASHHAKVEAIWKPFIESFENPEDAKFYVKNVLRARQAATMAVVKSIIEKLHERRG